MMDTIRLIGFSLLLSALVIAVGCPDIIERVTAP